MKGWWLLAGALVVPGIVQASEKCVFEWNFERETPALASWNYFNDTAAKAKLEFGELGGEKCLKTQGLYGFSHRFDEAVTIDGKVRKVSVKATVWLPSSPVHKIPFAISTREAVVPNTSWPFDGVADSGILVTACIFDSARHQQLAFIADGKEAFHTTGSVSPRNLAAGDQWVEWTLVYDNVAKTVFVYTSLEPERPRLKLYHVDLQGKTLRSVFLPAQWVGHRSGKVVVE